MNQVKAPEQKKTETQAPKKKLIAKKCFLIWQNDYCREIEAGEDISDIPERFHQNLKTEGVI